MSLPTLVAAGLATGVLTLVVVALLATTAEDVWTGGIAYPYISDMAAATEASSYVRLHPPARIPAYI